MTRSDSNSSLSSMSSVSSMASTTSVASSTSLASNSEDSRRQLHLECEQTRRKNLKDSLEDLKNNIPSCEGQKLTKAVILSRSIAYVQQTKRQKEAMAAQIQQLKQELLFMRANCTCNQKTVAAPDFNFTPSISIPDTPSSGDSSMVDYQPIQPRHYHEETSIPILVSHSSPLPQRPQPPPNTKFRPNSNLSAKPPRTRTLSGGFSVPGTGEIPPPPQYTFVNKQLAAPQKQHTLPGGHFVSSLSPNSMASPKPPASPMSPAPPLDLPEGWEEACTPDGKVFYLNKEFGLTSWVDPRTNPALRKRLAAVMTPSAAWVQNESPESLPLVQSSGESDWGSYVPDTPLPDISGMTFLSMDSSDPPPSSQLLPARPSLLPMDEGYHSRDSSGDVVHSRGFR